MPVTITGISTSIPIAGPFKSSAGSFYFIGVSSADATKIRAYKATDPSNSWSNVGTDPAITNAVTVDWISVWSDGSTLHVGTASTPSDSTTADYYYKTFDMSSDSWTAMNEAIATGVAVNAAAGTKRGISICKRTSSGEMLVLYQGTYLYMSALYAAVYYTRRTGTDTWTSGVNVYVDNTEIYAPRVIADPQNDRCYFSYCRSNTSIYLQVISAANALSGTQNLTIATLSGVYPPSITSITGWNDNGTSRFVVASASGTAGSLVLTRWEGGDSITRTTVNIASTAGRPIRIIHDGTNTGTSDVWVIYRNTSDSDLYVKQSTNDGATLGSETSAFTATINADVVMSIDADRQGLIISTGYYFVIPYFVNDNGTLKYNEYSVRSSATQWTGSATFAGAGALSAQTSQSLIASVSFAGVSTLAAQSMSSMLASASFSGASSFLSNGIVQKWAQATFTGSGVLSVDTELILGSVKFVSALFSGASVLAADAIRRANVAATFSGSGLFSANVLSGTFNINGWIFKDYLEQTNGGWVSTTIRQRLDPSLLKLVDLSGYIRAYVDFAAGTDGQIDAAYIGHAAAAGDAYDFDGNQVQLTFGGSNTKTVSGAVRVKSDSKAFSYDATKAIIVSVAFSGTAINLRGN